MLLWNTNWPVSYNRRTKIICSDSIPFWMGSLWVLSSVLLGSWVVAEVLDSVQWLCFVTKSVFDENSDKIWFLITHLTCGRCWNWVSARWQLKRNPQYVSFLVFNWYICVLYGVYCLGTYKISIKMFFQELDFCLCNMCL